MHFSGTLSKEDRRSQAGSFKTVLGSGYEYLENQCAAPGEWNFCMPPECEIFIPSLERKNSSVLAMEQISGIFRF